MCGPEGGEQGDDPPLFPGVGYGFLTSGLLRMRERNEHTPSPDLPVLQSASATCGGPQMSVLSTCIPKGLALYYASRV